MSYSSRLSFPTLALVSMTLVSLVACGGPSEKAPAATEEPVAGAVSEAPSDDPAPASYSMRGEVQEVITGDSGEQSLKLQHEAIDDLVGVDGEVWGMDSMTMKFAVAPDVSLDGIEAGDKVRVTLVVDWVGAVPQQLTEVEELPAETELEFRAAIVPGEREAEADDAEDASGDEMAESGEGHSGH